MDHKETIKWMNDKSAALSILSYRININGKRLFSRPTKGLLNFKIAEVDQHSFQHYLMTLYHRL